MESNIGDLVAMVRKIDIGDLAVMQTLFNIWG